MNGILTTTPFGRRTLSLGMLATQLAAEACPADAIVHKWKVFHAICEAKALLGISDRALSVLNALLSFHPETMLTGDGGLVVFPSNANLSLRAHGMAPATLRRHLAALVETGLIIRRDSPNGKRYARKGQGTTIESAFGFDLTPLVVRAGEFESLAESVRRERRALLLLRERITLQRRDIAKMIATGLQEGIAGDWAALQFTYLALVRRIPRKPVRIELDPILTELEFLTREIRNALELHLFSKKTSTNESQIERHIQNSDSNYIIESEHPFEKKDSKSTAYPETEHAFKMPWTEIRLLPLEIPDQRAAEISAKFQLEPPTAFPLGMVLEACPDIAEYARNGIRTWRDFLTATELVQSMLGINSGAWNEACQVLGREAAGVVIAAMLQRTEAIRNASGYLRSLTRKARAGQFSLRPMLMALIHKKLRPQRIHA